MLAQPRAADQLADFVPGLGRVEDGDEDHVVVGNLDDLECAQPQFAHLGETCAELCVSRLRDRLREVMVVNEGEHEPHYEASGRTPS